jgi:hypothetical protein
VTEKFREAVKAMTERQHVPLYQFNHQERKDVFANGVTQEKTQAFQGKKVDGQFWFTRDYGWSEDPRLQPREGRRENSTAGLATGRSERPRRVRSNSESTRNSYPQRCAAAWRPQRHVPGCCRPGGAGISR